MKLYEELLDGSEIANLVTLVNDLRTAGRRGQFQGKFTNFLSFDDEKVTSHFISMIFLFVFCFCFVFADACDS